MIDSVRIKNYNDFPGSIPGFFMPKTLNNSEFFEIATQVDALSTKQISSSRTNITINDGPAFPSQSRIKCQATELISNLGLDNSTAIALSTPEAEAIGGAGLFTFDKKNGYEFCLPRFHIGPAAQLDMYIAITQLASTSIMRQTINDSDPDNSGIIQFTREGHLTNWQVAAWQITGKNLPTTLIKISHQKANNAYTRIAHIDGELNLEGFATHPKRLFICDPIASGMQHIAMIEHLERINRLPQEIVVVAPMATLYGLQVIALSCQKRNISFKAGVLGTFLDSKAPLRYYSPYPKDDNQIANLKIAKFIKNALGTQLHDWCIRCNWTASFMGGPILPMTASTTELASLGLTNQALDRIQHQITLEQAKKVGIDASLIPFSTKQAVRKNS